MFYACCSIVSNVDATSFRSHDSHMMLHSVSLLDYCPYGIGAIHYISQHNLLIIAGWSDDQEEHGESSNYNDKNLCVCVLNVYFGSRPYYVFSIKIYCSL